MTFEVEWATLGRAVSGLLSEVQRVPEPSVRAAGSAQVALYGVLHQVHRGLVGGRTFGPVTVRSIGGHPVGALGRILRDTVRTRRPDAGTFDVLTTPPTSKADALWGAVLRHASLAAGEWQTRGSTPTGDAAWSLMGDVAMLSETASVLDEDLAIALRASGRATDADALLGGAARHLRLAGARAVQLSASGPQPATVVTPASSQRPVLVASAASVAEGQRRLARFLRSADDVTPHSVFVVAALTAQSALVSAKHASNPAVADALHDHAQGLADAAKLVGRCATIRDGDPRPEAQAYELRRHLRSVPAGSGAADAAAAFAAGLPDVIHALAGCAQRQNTQGRWLVPATAPGSPMWQRSGLGVESVPPFVDELVQLATSQDPRLPALGPPPALVHALIVMPPRTTLADLRSAGIAPIRPASPAQPPAAGRRR